MNEAYEMYESKSVAKYHYGDCISDLQMTLCNHYHGFSICMKESSIEEAMKKYGESHHHFEKDWKNHIYFLNDSIMQYSRIENDNGNPLTESQKEKWKAGKIDAYWVVYEFYIVEIRAVTSNEIKIRKD